jgi:hypothetical protein
VRSARCSGSSARGGADPALAGPWGDVSPAASRRRGARPPARARGRGPLRPTRLDCTRPVRRRAWQATELRLRDPRVLDQDQREQLQLGPHFACGERSGKLGRWHADPLRLSHRQRVRGVGGVRVVVGGERLVEVVVADEWFEFGSTLTLVRNLLVREARGLSVLHARKRAAQVVELVGSSSASRATVSAAGVGRGESWVRVDRRKAPSPDARVPASSRPAAGQHGPATGLV